MGYFRMTSADKGKIRFNNVTRGEQQLSSQK